MSVLESPTGRQVSVKWSLNDLVLLMRDILGRFPQAESLNRQLSDKTISRLFDTASLKQFKKKMGLPEEYQPGQPLPRQAYEVSPIISHDLEPFKVIVGHQDGDTRLTVDTDGFIELPDDYFYYSSMVHAVDMIDKQLRLVPDEEFDKLVGDPLIAPNDRNPIANLQFGYIRVAPKTITEVAFTYLKRPTKPVYRTKTTNRYRQYDDVNSVEFEWDDINRFDILHLMLFDLGINLQRNDIVQYAQKHQQQGV